MSGTITPKTESVTISGISYLFTTGSKTITEYDLITHCTNLIEVGEDFTMSKFRTFIKGVKKVKKI